jgi:hypothetical protein
MRCYLRTPLADYTGHDCLMLRLYRAIPYVGHTGIDSTPGILPLACGDAIPRSARVSDYSARLSSIRSPSRVWRSNRKSLLTVGPCSVRKVRVFSARSRFGPSAPAHMSLFCPPAICYSLLQPPRCSHVWRSVSHLPTLCKSFLRSFFGGTLNKKGKGRKG